MAFSTAPKTAKSAATVTLKDGTSPTALEVAVRRVQNIRFNGLTPKLREVVPVECRGKLEGLRLGNRVYPQITFDAHAFEFTETSAGTALDMIFGKTGTPFADRVSTTDDIGDVDTLDTVVAFEGTDLGDGADLGLTFEDVHWTVDFNENDDGNLITFTGVVYGLIDGDQDIAEG